MRDPAQLFTARALDIVRMTSDIFIAYSPREEAGVRLSERLCSALSVCRSSGTLTQLRNRIIQQLSLSEIQPSWAEQAIAFFVDARLVVPIQDLIGRRKHVPQPTRQITSIAFPTRGRPLKLERALTSFTSHFATHGRKPDVVIVDDFKGRGIGIEHVGGMMRASCEPGQVLRYAGYAERDAYVRALVAAGIEPRAANFALLGEWPGDHLTVGSARNTIALDTVDQRIISLDDDVLCKVVRHPAAGDGIRFQGHKGPREHWFFKNRETTLDEFTWAEECDYAGEHEILLGREVGELATTDVGSTNFINNSCDHLRMALEDGGSGKVVATMSGVVGDSGVHAASSWLILEGPSFSRLVKNAESLSDAMSTREILSVSPGRVVTHCPFFQAMGVGLANDLPLPPFLPVGRSEDGFFGHLVSLMAPRLFVGHIPLALFHDPDTGRTYSPFTHFRAAELMIALTSLVMPLHRRGSADCLAALGRELKYLSQMPLKEFAAYVYMAGVEHFRGHISSALANVKSIPDAPAWWLDKVAAMRDDLLARSTSLISFIPTECRDGNDTQRGLSMTQQFVAVTGEMLSSWAAMQEVARNLSKRDVRASGKV